jgi:hypothetical protein
LPPPLAEKIKSSIHNRTKQDIANAVQSIVGKGPGLTPSGDDFLAGMMLSLWTMSDPAAHTVCRIILDSARKMTTDISLAYLRAIASGYTDERWHNLLYALAANNSRLLDSAIRHILAFGATSGSDMLIGFVWGLQQLNFHKL